MKPFSRNCWPSAKTEKNFIIDASKNQNVLSTTQLKSLTEDINYKRMSIVLNNKRNSNLVKVYCEYHSNIVANMKMSHLFSDFPQNFPQSIIYPLSIFLIFFHQNIIEVVP